MGKKKIKLIIAFLSFVILVLWFFPTLIYNFDEYCLSYMKEEIIKSTPNVYNLIFGGKVGGVEYDASSPAIIIFLLHIYATRCLWEKNGWCRLPGLPMRFP